MDKQFPLWTALVTPFTPNLEVDFESLEKLIQEQVNANNGLLVLGSTGEALNISLENKKKIVEFVQTLDINVPLMIGVGGHDLEQTKNWVNWLETQKIDAYLMVTPIYSKPSDEGQYHWFKTLMDLSSRPVMLYNVPGRSGTSLSLRAVERLKDHRNYWSIKEASGSVEQFKKYLQSSGNKPVFCGDDGLFLDFSLNGSCGLVSVASNVWPVETQEYVKQCLNKTFDAKELWETASASLFMTSNPVPAKRLLFEEKRISYKTMMPPLSEDDLTDPSIIVESSKKIKKWYKELK